MIATFLAPLLAILPGFPTAYFLRAPGEHFDSIACKAVVWSLAIVSLIAWAPFGTHIPLDQWLWSMAILSSAGAVIVAFALRSRQRQKFSRAVIILGASAIVVFIAFGIILFVEAIVGWDAITYYLFSAVDMTIWGHYSNFFSPSVTLASHAPNTVMPIMPVLYGLAILIAQHLHSYADQAMRLIPLVFIAGTWLATRRIASYFMPRSWALVAATVFLLLPGYVTVVCGAPLSLDLGFCFLCTQLVSELVERDLRFTGFFQLGITAAVTIVDKIDGLPFVCLLLFVVLVTRLPTMLARFVVGLVSIAMFGAAIALHMYARYASVELFVSIIIVGTAFVVSMRKAPESRIPWFGPFAFALGLVPAYFQIWKLCLLTGSPAGFYIPNLATNQSAAWHQAVRLIGKANVFAPTLPPGMPENFGIGLLFWWGFAPALVILAIVGAVSAYRSNRHGVMLIASIALLFDFAFLTIFSLDDYRHLLPVSPLIAILATIGVRSAARTLPSRVTIIMVGLIATIPFAWTAQQRLFNPPFVFLQALQFDQWDALSFGAIINIVLLLAALALLLKALIGGERSSSVVDTIACSSHWKRAELALISPRGRALAISITSLIGLLVFFSTGFPWVLLLAPASAVALAAYYRSKPRVPIATLALSSTIVLLLLGWFEPLVAAAVSPGFAIQSATVEQNEEAGYLPVLRWAMRDPSIRNILAYNAYGMTWFSLGAERSVDLVDASDVATLGSGLHGLSFDSLYRRNINAAITPSIGSASYAYFERLGQSLGTYTVPMLNDPLQGYSVSTFRTDGNWTFTRLFAPMLGPVIPSAKIAVIAEGHIVDISDGKINVAHQATISALQISLGRRLVGSIPVKIEVLGYAIGDDGLKEPYFFRATTASQSGAIRLSTRALLGAANQLGLATSPIVLRSISVIPLNSNRWSLGFSSEGLILGTDRTISGLPFIESGNQNFVDRIDAYGRFGDEALWPYPVPIDKTSTRSRLTFSLHPTSSCKPGSTVVIKVIGDDFVRSTIARIPRLPEITSVAAVQLLSNTDSVAISSIVFSGNSSGCRIQERFASKDLMISLYGVSEQRWVDGLHVVAIQRR